MRYFDGGAGGVGAACVEDKVPVQLVRLLHLVLPHPIVLAELKGRLDLAQRDVERAGNLSVVLQFLRVPHINKRDVPGELQGAELFEVQLGAAVDAAWRGGGGGVREGLVAGGGERGPGGAVGGAGAGVVGGGGGGVGELLAAVPTREGCDAWDAGQ